MTPRRLSLLLLNGLFLGVLVNSTDVVTTPEPKTQALIDDGIITGTVKTDADAAKVGFSTEALFRPAALVTPLAAPPADPVLSARLVGVVAGAEHDIAVIQLPNSIQLLRRYEGQKLEDWIVSEVDRKTAILERRGEQLRLDLDPPAPRSTDAAN
jgi:hypothetical protein